MDFYDLHSVSIFHHATNTPVFLSACIADFRQVIVFIRLCQPESNLQKFSKGLLFAFGLEDCCGFVIYDPIFPLYKSERGKIKS